MVERAIDLEFAQVLLDGRVVPPRAQLLEQVVDRQVLLHADRLADLPALDGAPLGEERLVQHARAREVGVARHRLLLHPAHDARHRAHLVVEPRVRRRLRVVPPPVLARRRVDAPRDRGVRRGHQVPTFRLVGGHLARDRVLRRDARHVRPVAVEDGAHDVARVVRRVVDASVDRRVEARLGRAVLELARRQRARAQVHGGVADHPQVGVVGRRPVAAGEDVPLAGGVVPRHEVELGEHARAVRPVASREQEVRAAAAGRHEEQQTQRARHFRSDDGSLVRLSFVGSAM